MYYYNGESVHNVRFYHAKGRDMVEFTLHGERMAMDGSVLTTEIPEMPYIRGVIYEKSEQPDTLNIEESEVTEPDTTEQDLSDVAESEELEPEVVEQVVEDSTEVDQGVNQEVASEFEGQSLLVDDPDEDTTEMVYGSEEFVALVEEHNLDVEAIDRILRDEQKTHKGFSFALV